VAEAFGVVLLPDFLLLEQAASVAAAVAPPMPSSIDRRLTPALPRGSEGLGTLSEAVSAMTPPWAIRRGGNPSGTR
jgi:hypothetical protein